MSQSGTNPKEDTVVASDEKEKGIMDQYANYIDDLFARIFSTIGTYVSINPWKMVGFTLLLTILLSLGIININIENRGDKLWVPQNTQSSTDESIYDSLFTQARVEFVIIEAKVCL